MAAASPAAGSTAPQALAAPGPPAPGATLAPASRRGATPSGPTGPSPAEPPRPRFLRRRRAESAALLAPVLGLFALMPPFINVFAHDGRLFGAPAILIFLLAVWIGLIVATRRLARRLGAADPEP